MIRINVFIQVSPENRAKVLTAAKALTIESQKETGNIAYDIFESSTRPGVLLICETWKDAEVLAAHEKTAHFSKYIAEMQALASLKVEKFNF